MQSCWCYSFCSAFSFFCGMYVYGWFWFCLVSFTSSKLFLFFFRFLNVVKKHSLVPTLQRCCKNTGLWMLWRWKVRYLYTTGIYLCDGGFVIKGTSKHCSWKMAMLKQILQLEIPRRRGTSNCTSLFGKVLAYPHNYLIQIAADCKESKEVANWRYFFILPPPPPPSNLPFSIWKRT